MRILLIRKRGQDTILKARESAWDRRNPSAKSGVNQPGGIEAIEPAQPGVLVRQMAGRQGIAQIAIGIEGFAEACDLRRPRSRAPACIAGSSASSASDGLLAFFRFERTGAVDQRAARLQACSPTALCSNRFLQCRPARRYRPAAGARRHRGGDGWFRSNRREHRPGRSRSLRRHLGLAHSAASDTTVSACSDNRLRFSRTAAPMRPGERSTAITRARRPWTSCAVLPPGAAQRSATDFPMTSPNRRAGNAAAASCTHHWPSAKPGSIFTEPCSSVRTVPVSSVYRAVRSRVALRGIGFDGDVERGFMAEAPPRSLLQWFRRNARSSAPASTREYRVSAP